MAQLLFATSIGAALLFAVYGFILAYHWFRYSLHKGTAILSIIIYIAGGSVFLLVLFAITASFAI